VVGIGISRGRRIRCLFSVAFWIVFDFVEVSHSSMLLASFKM
jgi:hypothetical protein